MTIKAKFQGTCRICEGVIMPGDRIEWTRGSRIVTHADCTADVRRANGIGAPPARAQHEQARRAHRGSNVATFSSGESIYTNKRGRCEDAPCCGCCS